MDARAKLLEAVRERDEAQASLSVANKRWEAEVKSHVVTIDELADAVAALPESEG